MAITRSSVGEKGGVFWLVFGGIWLALGIIFLLVGYSMFSSNQRFAREGVAVNGEVVGKNVERSTKREKQSNGTYRDEVTESYKVLYSFSAANGQKVEGRDYLGKSEWDKLTQGGQVSVQYLSSDPLQNRLTAGSDEVGAYVFSGLGLVITLLGGFICSFYVRSRMLRRRLIREGMKAIATITSVGPGNLSINNVPQWVVAYTFKDLMGRTHNCQSGYLSPQDGAAWKPGDTGEVRYDRNHPDKNVWLGTLTEAAREMSSAA